jgi:hypothetical protein
MNSLLNFEDEIDPFVSYSIAILPNGQYIRALDLVGVPRPETLICPACETRLSIRAGNKRRPHFAHIDRDEKACILHRYLHFHGILLAQEMIREHIAKNIPIVVQQNIQQICNKYISLRGEPCSYQKSLSINIIENLVDAVLVPTDFKWAPMLLLQYRGGASVQLEIRTKSPTGHKFNGPILFIDIRKEGLRHILPKNIAMDRDFRTNDDCRCEAKTAPGIIIYNSGSVWAGLKTYPEWIQVKNYGNAAFIEVEGESTRPIDWLSYFLEKPAIRRRLPRSCTYCAYQLKEFDGFYCIKTGEQLDPENRAIAENCEDFDSRILTSAGIFIDTNGGIWAGIKTISEWAAIQKARTTEFVYLKDANFVPKDWVSYFLQLKDVRAALQRSCRKCIHKQFDGPDIICKKTGELFPAANALEVAKRCDFFSE